MSKITFIACKVTIEKTEQNYKDYSIELESIKKLTLDGENRTCNVTMKDDTEIEIQYYDNTVIS